jgi:hypothetical protein
MDKTGLGCAIWEGKQGARRLDDEFVITAIVFLTADGSIVIRPTSFLPFRV